MKKEKKRKKKRKMKKKMKKWKNKKEKKEKKKQKQKMNYIFWLNDAKIKILYVFSSSGKHLCAKISPSLLYLYSKMQEWWNTVWWVTKNLKRYHCLISTKNKSI